jgi:ubiquinone/menaquinone biosynthesis C-methylase UbiE
LSLADDMRKAYDDAADAWSEGPARVYRALGAPVLEAAGDIRARTVLDVGTGSGVLADALVRGGARVLALDLSLGMLRRDAGARPPAVVADVRQLPVRTAVADLVTASFVLNHLDDPVLGIRELRRVLRPGGRALATTFEGEAPHPAKNVVDAVAASFGYTAPGWYLQVRTGTMPLLGTTRSFADAGREAGLADVRVEQVVVSLALGPRELAGWRFGMAHLAPFVAQLTTARREAMLAEAEARLTDVPGMVELPVLLLSGSA